MGILPPRYIGLDEAREVLAALGVVLTPRQMKRAADKGSDGRRKLPFFIDPIDGTLRIERSALVAAYERRQDEAERSCRPPSP